VFPQAPLFLKVTLAHRSASSAGQTPGSQQQQLHREDAQGDVENDRQLGSDHASVLFLLQRDNLDEKAKASGR